MAFGDSLTVGYHSATLGEEWPEPTPYTGFLETSTRQMLSQRGAPGIRVEFLNRGIVGEVTGEMLDRFERDVLEQRPAAVIILGGSNDLGWGIEVQVVADNLSSMAEDALSAGIQPVACTVPSVLGFDEGIPPRRILNGLIKKHSAERDMICVDIFSSTSDSEGRLRQDYSDDGLHMSALGYEAMAQAIFTDAVRKMVLGHL